MLPDAGGAAGRLVRLAVSKNRDLLCRGTFAGSASSGTTRSLQ